MTTQLSLWSDAAVLLGRLRAFGLESVDRCRLTTNRTVMVSFSGRELRVHRAFVGAPDDVVRAIAVFVVGRGKARRAARQTILRFPVSGAEMRAPRRRERSHPDDELLVRRLTTLHEQFNAERFNMGLRPVDMRVSRRMRRRLGSYYPSAGDAPATIVISRRHIRRHGWSVVADTLLHEMIHQWQDESGRRLDHGAEFRRLARSLGIHASATAPVGDLVARARAASA